MSRDLKVDLNTDMGEGFGAYTMGDDDAILEVVTSANIACGFHAGDPEIMARTFAQANKKGVAVGAHPGFPDLWGFGRRVVSFTPGQIERLVAYQIGAAQALSEYAGHPITHVKAHGALSNLTQTDPEVAAAVSRAVKAVDPSLICLVMAVGVHAQIANDMGLKTRGEIFADRAYTEEGYLMPRNQPGAVIHDPMEAAQRIVRMVKAQGVETISGRIVKCPVDSICVHSDTPAAVEIAATVRRELEAASIKVCSFI
ncbi:LamB/YcsF family protein [Pseudomonas aeruginosa]|nr:LamB/YcsF family protein [Pseudomonas aeruginosa]